MSAEQARLARRYGYVFQAPALFPWRTSEKNLKLPLEVMVFPIASSGSERARYLAAGQSHRLRAQVPLAIVRRYAAAGLDSRRAVVRSGPCCNGRTVRRAGEIVRDNLNEQLLQLWDKTEKRCCS